MHLAIAILEVVEVYFFCKKTESNHSFSPPYTPFKLRNWSRTIIFRKALYCYISNAVNNILPLAKLLRNPHFSSVWNLNLLPFHPSPPYSSPPLSLSRIPRDSSVKRRFSLHEKFSLPSQPDTLPPWPHPLSHPVLLRAQRRRACCCRRPSTPRKSPPASLTRRFTHPHLLDASATSVSDSLEPTPHQNAISQSAILLL